MKRLIRFAQNYHIVAATLACAGILVFSASCGGNPAGTTIDDAWAAFEAKDYPGALAQFTALTSDASVQAEANTGAGWSSLRLYDYVNANTYFGNVPSDIDANAGLSFSEWAQGNNSGAIVKADFVLTASPTYTFLHDTQITASKLILVKAYAYYELAQYGPCLTMIKQLDGPYNPTIAPADSAQVLVDKLTALGPVS